MTIKLFGGRPFRITMPENTPEEDAELLADNVEALKLFENQFKEAPRRPSKLVVLWAFSPLLIIPLCYLLGWRP